MRRARKTRATVFDIGGVKKRIAELEEKTAVPDFWADRVAVEATVSEIAELKTEAARWDDIGARIAKEGAQIGLLVEWEQELGNEEPERIQELIATCQKAIRELEAEFSRFENQAFMAGAYDKLSATLGVSSGAGGRDAEDWAAMLLRMYMHAAQKKGWRVTLLHEHRGEEGGTKNATIEMNGRFAYGTLRFETGVHRLVRISPFDANKRRHTSFASVEVLPVLTKDLSKKIEIKPEDMEVSTSRSSGPGGQNVNRRETAVRIVHIPTGLVAECQTERLQGENKLRAMELIAAKLAAREEEARRAELAKLKGGRVSTSWGNQIRSYVLHPYQMVKDHRTGVEVGNAQSVLEGNLDSFFEAELHQFGERKL